MMPCGRVISSLIPFQIPAGKPDLLQRQQRALAVQEPEHDAFAEGRGHDRNADVHVLAADLDAHAAVLGQPLLGDVQAGHDLDARRDACLVPLLNGQDVVEDAVDAEPGDQVLLEGLDVDVARPLADGLGQERIDQPDDGRVVGDLEQVRGLFQLRGQERKIVLLHLLDRVLGLVHFLAVETVDGIEDLFGRGEPERNIGVEQDAQIVDGRERKRFGGRGDDGCRSPGGAEAPALFSHR